MPRTIRGHPTTQPQPEGREKLEINPSIPQQEEQTDAIDGEVIVDHKPDIDHEPEGSDPENKPDAHEEQEKEYTKMELHQQGTIHKWSMNHRVLERIKWVHQLQGPENMALWLHDMYLWLGFSPEAVKLLVREQGLDSPERLRDLTNKNADDISNVVRKLLKISLQITTGFSHSS